ncbi:MAG: sulfoxide reductase heme-binding subunit YedZ [Magnetococcus sp. MYC-9]
MSPLKVMLFLAGLLPLFWLLYGAWTDGLGANPIERIIRWNGDWALWWLLLTLCVAPMQRLPGCGGLSRLRRMAGLFSFFYLFLHVLGYGVLDKYFAWQDIVLDVRKRPYITVGMAAFLLLLPLAITSTQGWMRRLGRHWRRLHRGVYPAALLGVLHHFLMVKADWRTPALEALVLATLLGWRVWIVHRRIRTV